MEVNYGTGESLRFTRKSKDCIYKSKAKLYNEKRQSEGSVVPMMNKTTKLILGKGPYFVQVL